MKNCTLSTEVFERYLDASVELFMECYAETITIYSDATAQEQDSPRLNEKCRTLIKATRRRKKLLGFVKGSARLLKSTAIVAIAFLALNSFLFITVEAVREPILNFYIKQNNGNWEISNIPFESKPDDPMYTAPEAGFNEEDPLQYLLPEEFSLYSIEGNLESGMTALYSNQEQKQNILFRCVKENTYYHIDTESAEISRFELSGCDAVLSAKNDTQSIILTWYNSNLDRILMLQSDCMSGEQLITLAETLNYILLQQF